MRSEESETAMREWLRRPRLRLRNGSESEFKRRLKRRETRGREGREEAGRRERHSKRRSSGKAEMAVAGVGMGVEMKRRGRGEGVEKWRCGSLSEGMQGLVSHERLREWQLELSLSLSLSAMKSVATSCTSV